VIADRQPEGNVGKLGRGKESEKLKVQAKMDE
jgi:hypothetical protein